MPVSRKRSDTPSQRKPSLSPTRIATYLECAVKYRYIYLDKIGKFYLRSRSYYSFGSSLHKVLEEFHQGGGVHTASEMTQELEQTWISAGYQSQEQEQEHRQLGEQIVERYHASYQERAIAQVETIATEKTITCDLGLFKLTGRIDRLDRHSDGRLEIVDYKSGRLETSEEEITGDLAMSCYQLILSKLYPATPISATIYSLRSGHTATTSLTQEALETFERDILVLGDEILQRDYTEILPVPVESCPSCDFLSRCERFWKSVAEVPVEPFFAEGDG